MGDTGSGQRSNHVTAATIYGGHDGWIQEEEGFLHDDMYPSSSSSSSYSSFPTTRSPSSSLAELLTQTQIAPLVRLAVAFSPPGHALSLQDVQAVHVVNVDEHHLDISAVVCEDSGCVTLFCPVTFPHECQQLEEGCVMENLIQLDLEAEKLLQQKDYLAAHEEEEAQSRRILTSSHGLNFPHWWIFPDTDMTADCDMIRSLLNSNDFEDAVRALATQAIASSSSSSSPPLSTEYEVDQAAIIAVGPAGLCLRAKAWSLDVYDSGDAKYLDLTVQFPKIASSAQDLRTTILSQVAMVSSDEDACENDDHVQQISKDDCQDLRTNFGLPSWWVFVSEKDNRSLYEACRSVRFLLNQEDYQPEVQALLRQHHHHDGGGRVGDLQYAEVVTVSTAGLLLRAKLIETGTFVKVGLPFSHVASDPADLYSLVVEAVALASTYIVSTQKNEEGGMLELPVCYGKKVTDYLGFRAKYYDPKP